MSERELVAQMFMAGVATVVMVVALSLWLGERPDEAPPPAASREVTRVEAVRPARVDADAPPVSVQPPETPAAIAAERTPPGAAQAAPDRAGAARVAPAPVTPAPAAPEQVPAAQAAPAPAAPAPAAPAPAASAPAAPAAEIPSSDVASRAGPTPPSLPGSATAKPVDTTTQTAQIPQAQIPQAQAPQAAEPRPQSDAPASPRSAAGASSAQRDEVRSLPLVEL